MRSYSLRRFFFNSAEERIIQSIKPVCFSWVTGIYWICLCICTEFTPPLIFPNCHLYPPCCHGGSLSFVILPLILEICFSNLSWPSFADGSAQCQLPAGWLPASYHRPTHPTHPQWLPATGKSSLVNYPLPVSHPQWLPATGKSSLVNYPLPVSQSS